MIRSEPPAPNGVGESDSLPMPMSLPSPLSAGGMLVGSAGRATGRVRGAGGADGLGVGAGLAEGVVVAFLGAAAALPGAEGRLATALGFAALRALGAARLAVARLAVARFARVLPARVAVDERRPLLARFVPLVLALVLADDRLASVLPAFLAVIRLAAEVGFLAVERLAVDFFDEDFFFAGISPPSGARTTAREWLQRGATVRLFSLRVIASATAKDKHLRTLRRPGSDRDPVQPSPMSVSF